MKQLSFFNKFVFALNLVFALLLLLSCTVPYISSETFSFLSILSLAVPFLVVLNMLCFIYWLLKRKRQLILSLLVLLLGFVVHGSFFKFKFSGDPIAEKDLSIMTFNALNFTFNGAAEGYDVSEEIVDFVASQNPDIVCFQEFDYKKKRSDHFSQYPYRFIDFEYGVYTGRVIQAIYSKYPIINKRVLDFPRSANSAIFADIVYNKDTLRVYNLHLQSLSIRPEAFADEPSGKLYKRVTESFLKQQQQVSIIVDHKNKTSYKRIICGDFNNTQFSNVYYTVKGEMTDTFKEKGSGFGRTYDFAGFPGRIDFILVDPSFEVTAHKNFDIELSDHFPVMSSIRMKTK
ncbi:MAG: endonuclease/exonuclease/phosphatase family protein [Saonia sp.]